MGWSLSPYIFHQVCHTFVVLSHLSIGVRLLRPTANTASFVPPARSSRYTSVAFCRRLSHLRMDSGDDSRHLESTWPRCASLQEILAAGPGGRAPRFGHRPEARRVSSTRREARRDSDVGVGVALLRAPRAINVGYQSAGWPCLRASPVPLSGYCTGQVLPPRAARRGDHEDPLGRTRTNDSAAAPRS
eukprot:scaffold474274_cov18-Prasinocladus_malaysianus.AAC.1